VRPSQPQQHAAHVLQVQVGLGEGGYLYLCRVQNLVLQVHVLHDGYLVDGRNERVGPPPLVDLLKPLLFFVQ
jgi:hypothetical protein